MVGRKLHVFWPCCFLLPVDTPELTLWFTGWPWSLLFPTHQINSRLGFVGFLTELACEMIGAVLFRRSPLLLSTAAAVRLMFSQMKSAVENYFPGETKTPQCFQLCSEISGYWRGKKEFLTPFFDRTSKCFWFLRSNSCMYLLGLFLFDASIWHSGHLWVRLLCLVF